MARAVQDGGGGRNGSRQRCKRLLLATCSLTHSASSLLSCWSRVTNSESTAVTVSSAVTYNSTHQTISQLIPSGQTALCLEVKGPNLDSYWRWKARAGCSQSRSEAGESPDGPGRGWEEAASEDLRFRIQQARDEFISKEWSWISCIHGSRDCFQRQEIWCKGWHLLSFPLPSMNPHTSQLVQPPELDCCK